MNTLTIKENLQEIAEELAANRQSRQKRRELDRSDFDKLTDAGFHLTGVLAEHGGIWQNIPDSTRTICDLLRILARGDSSLALVSSMHPSVLAFWLATPELDSDQNADWQAQRNEFSQLALSRELWGTITSEPGSGGDVFKTKTVAKPNGSGYKISGLKHFGSGSGIFDFMITTAVADGETEPDIFILDMRNVAWDGSHGVKLMFPWDGHGMIATQSHSLQFENYPAVRIAAPGNIIKLGEAANEFIACCFTAVIVGIIEIAVETAKDRLQSRHASLHAYEQVEWSKVELESWLIQQAYEGMLHTVEQDRPDALRNTLIGETAVAELAESIMTRLCRVMGGGTFSRHSPFGFWFQDVRALGFLRPPWVLAYDQIFASSWADS